MFDNFTGAPVFVSTVNVSWNGYGPVSSMIDNSHFRSPGLMVNSRFMGTSMQALASGVVTDGTAKLARIDGYNIAGKTGTAQKLVGGHYSHSDHFASFIGFLPSRNPALAIVGAALVLAAMVWRVLAGQRARAT